MIGNFCASQSLLQMCKHSFTYLSVYRRRDGAAILLTRLKSKPRVTNVMAKCSQRRLLKSSASGQHSGLLITQFEQSPTDSDCLRRMRAGADSSWASPPPHGDASSKWEEEMSNFSIGGKNDNRTVKRGGSGGHVTHYPIQKQIWFVYGVCVLERLEIALLTFSQVQCETETSNK